MTKEGVLPVTVEMLTPEQIHALHPTAYGGITGTFECTLEEQLDCYRADGTYACSPDERLAARQRICDAINAQPYPGSVMSDGGRDRAPDG